MALLSNLGSTLLRAARAGSIPCVLGLILVGLPAEAWTQTESVLYSFGNFPGDSYGPGEKLLLDSSGNLVGTAFEGSETLCDGESAYGCGTVFQLTPSANGYTENILYSFGSSSSISDGADPTAGLVSDSSGNLYGTTYYGGDFSLCPGGDDNGLFGCGTVFELEKSPTGYTESVLHIFEISDGAYPFAGLTIDSSGNLYGTAASGGVCGGGVVFELVKSPAGYTENVLHSFGCGSGDGSGPYATLVADSAGDLFGTAESAGDLSACGGFGCGVVFEMVNSGGSYTEKVIYSFQGSDGQMPVGSLIEDASGNLYGTTEEGGSNGYGTVFELVNSSGSYTEKVLYSFRGAAENDGQWPVAGLVMDPAGSLFGTTRLGGSGCGTQGCGIVFELASSSGSYVERVLHRFGSPGDGESVSSQLVMDSAGNLYGTTDAGGATICDCGTVFQINPTAIAPVATVSLLDLTFTDQVVGSTSASQPITVTNTGSASLVFPPNAVTFSGPNAGDFALGSNTCSGATIAAGASCTVQVTFSPSAVETESASLNFADNGSTSPQVAGLTGSGVAAPVVTLTPATITFPPQSVRTESGAQAVTLRNTGTGQLNITAIPPIPDFIFGTTCGSTVAPGASCTFNVQFDPLTSGVITQAIMISDNALNSPQAITLSGTGTAPEASLSPGTLVFGSQIVGHTSAVQSVTLSNTGNADLNGLSVGIGEGDVQDFAISPAGTTCLTGTVVSAGSSCVIDVAFTPTASGTRSAVLVLTDDNNNQNNSSQMATFSGTGQDFGVAVAPGTSSTATVSPGGTATYTVAASPLSGFSQPVAFACNGGLLQGTCTVSPGTVPMNGTSASTATVTISTNGAAAASINDWSSGRNQRSSAWLGSLAAASLMGFLWAASVPLVEAGKQKPLLRRFGSVAIIASTAILASCGGGGNASPPPKPATPPGNYTFAITGTSGNLSHFTTVTLTVN